MSKRTDKPTTTIPHEAGCACGPCHNERTLERGTRPQKLPPEACGVLDGDRGRGCTYKKGHESYHFTGMRIFRDAEPAEKSKRAKTPAKAPKATPIHQSEAMVAPHVCANAARDPSSGKPLKGALARSCEREPGHEGLHRIGPHGELEHVIEWEDGKPGWVSYNRKAQRPMTLEDEPEDSDADDAALASMDADARNEVDDDEPGDLADDEDPRPQWLKELSAKHREEREAKVAEIEGATVDEPPAKPEVDPAAGRMDGKDCGIIGARGTACVLDHEHEGEHRDYMGRAWPANKPRSKKPEGGDLFGYVAPKGEPSSEALIPATGPTITCGGKVYPVHPLARIFPTPESQYRRLVDSIATNGQRHAVELMANEPGTPVIDGCSRLRACEQLGIEPVVKLITVDNPLMHVVAVNLDRRQMNESQRAMVGADFATLEHGTNQHDARTGRFAAPTQAEAAVLVGVSERLVRDAVRLKNKAEPEVGEAVRAGKMRVSTGIDLADLPPSEQRELVEKTTKGNGEAKPGKIAALVRQAKKREVVHTINRGLVGPMPDGPFGLIVVDYPWLYQNSNQHEGSRGHMPYPGMPMVEIYAHAGEASKRAADNCVLGLWVTNAFVAKLERVVEAWGFEDHTVWTWDKCTEKNELDKAGVGSWGRGRTEHLLVCSRGKPVHTLNEVGTLIRAPVRGHSEKPVEFYDLLEKHCSGPRLELFAIGARKGWETWGAEAQKPVTTERKRQSKIFTATDARVGQGPAA